MRTGRPKAILTLPATNARVLLAITRSRSLPAALTLRAKIVLAGLCGEPAEEKAHRGRSAGARRSADLRGPCFGASRSSASSSP